MSQLRPLTAAVIVSMMCNTQQQHTVTNNKRTRHETCNQNRNKKTWM